MFVNLQPIQSGNIPMLLLGSTGRIVYVNGQPDPDSYYPHVHASMDPTLGVPLLRSLDLQGEAYDPNFRPSFSLWLPTPTAPLSHQPKRTLSICWQMDQQGGGTLAPLDFQVKAISSPCHQGNSLLKYSSPGVQIENLSSIYTAGTSDNNVYKATEIGNIVPPSKPNMLTTLFVRLPVRTGGPAFTSLSLYLRGLAVDQW